MTSCLCKYKDIFGKVGQGIHSYRIFNVAIVDVLFTIGGAFVLSKYIKKYTFMLILVFLFLLGIVLHHLFCVHTTIDKLIFG